MGGKGSPKGRKRRKGQQERAQQRQQGRQQEVARATKGRGDQVNGFSCRNCHPEAIWRRGGRGRRKSQDRHLYFHRWTSSDGSVDVKKVVFKKPEQVDVLGSISDQKKRSDTYLKNSVNKMRPIAAQKILKTARYVLKAPSTVERKN